MQRSARMWKYENLQTLEIMVIHNNTITKSDFEGYNFVRRETGVPAIFTHVKGGKLRRRVDVPNKMVSDLSLWSAIPLWQN